ncbi:3',5'-cyclic-nucleotide phosphodiesterase [Aureococcus anophagefferens]|nr:3',5'-cyclic-nucleotide phosphodiesterase [Aureococcus anophagefferens]
MDGALKTRGMAKLAGMDLEELRHVADARAGAERRERRKAAALFQVMKAVHEADSQGRQLVTNLLSVAKDIMECEHVTMFFVDAARNVLIAANPLGTRSDGTSHDIVLPMGKGIAGIVQGGTRTDKLTGFSTRSILCAPVLDAGVTVSVIEALNKEDDRGFDEEDVFILKTICDELRGPLRRAAAEEAFKQRAAATDSEFGYLQQFTSAAARRGTVDAVQSARYHGEGLDADDRVIATLEWDALAVSEQSLYQAITVVVFAHHASLSRHDCDERKFQAFIRAVGDAYNDNPYHNFRHGVAVLHLSFVALCHTRRAKGLTSLDILSLKVAALCHDIDHPGWNNDFEVNSSSDKALLYNDVSVLENHHAAYTFGVLLRRPELDFLASIATDARKELRKVVISCILATDMSGHGKHVDELRRRGPPGLGKIVDDESPTHERRQFYMDTIIHLGDMAGQALPSYDTAKKWGYKIVEEFQNQAAKESKMGLPVSPFMAKLSTEVDVAMSQVAFIDYVVGPLITVVVVVKLFPELADLEANCKRNRELWADRAEEASVAQEMKEAEGKSGS